MITHVADRFFGVSVRGVGVHAWGYSADRKGRVDYRVGEMAIRDPEVEVGMRWAETAMVHHFKSDKPFDRRKRTSRVDYVSRSWGLVPGLVWYCDNPDAVALCRSVIDGSTPAPIFADYIEENMGDDGGVGMTAFQALLAGVRECKIALPRKRKRKKQEVDEKT